MTPQPQQRDPAQGEREYPTLTKRVPIDRGLQGILDRLADQRDEIAALERQLEAAKKRRRTLIAKCRKAGLSLRAIAPFAGITNVRIHQQESLAKGR